MSIRAPQTGPLIEDPSSSSRYMRLKPGPSQSQLDVIASQRSRLQRAIIDIAAQDGVEAVTVRRLTKLAGVSTATFYSRFSGTDDCLLSAYQEVMAGIVRSVAGARDPKLAPAEQLDRALRALLSQLMTDLDLARFALIEIYGGGPAAINATAVEERRLASALRGCIDRRGQRIPKPGAAAIVAAVLHCARTELIDAAPGGSAPVFDVAIEWAVDVIEGGEESAIPIGITSAQFGANSPQPPRRSSASGCDEKSLIMAAILRLARTDGFGGLDWGKVSAASGVPAARFRRHFATLVDGYLAAIRRTAAFFFAQLTSHGGPTPLADPSTQAALVAATQLAACDPEGARLTFTRVIEPGVAGLTCRETMISELALAYSIGTGLAATPIRVRAEAQVAALWETLAQRAVTAPS